MLIFNISKKAATVDIGLFNFQDLNDSSKIQAIQDCDSAWSKEIYSMIDFLNNELTSIVKSYDPSQQTEIDKMLRYPF